MSDFFRFLVFNLLLPGSLFSSYSLAFIHIGQKIPSYIFTCLQQARFTNPDCEIYFLIEEKAFKHLVESQDSFIKSQNITLVNLREIDKSAEHELFSRFSRFNLTFRNGFWNHASERFFFLYDFILSHNLRNVFQIETDVMLYQNLEFVLPIMISLNMKLAAPFEWENRCIPSIVYIKTPLDLKEYITYAVELYRTSPNDLNPDIFLNDMCSLGSFREKYGEEKISVLPTIMPDYHEVSSSISVSFHRREATLKFLSSNSAYFDAYLFDAATLGIYANGYDRRNDPSSKQGTIHHLSYFDPSQFKLRWEKTENKGLVPILEFENKKYKVVNLHFHSKLPHGFASYNRKPSSFPK